MVVVEQDVAVAERNTGDPELTIRQPGHGSRRLPIDDPALADSLDALARLIEQRGYHRVTGRWKRWEPISPNKLSANYPLPAKGGPVDIAVGLLLVLHPELDTLPPGDYHEYMRLYFKTRALHRPRPNHLVAYAHFWFGNHLWFCDHDTSNVEAVTAAIRCAAAAHRRRHA